MKIKLLSRIKPNLGYKELVAFLTSKSDSVERFEEKFAEKFNAKSALAFSYGRYAQFSFFKALGISKTEVIMPAYTCSVVAHAVTLSDNIPIFVDIDQNSFNMNLHKLRDTITENTSAIICTNTFGNPENNKIIHKLIEEAEKKYGRKIYFIQDCCHSFGATTDNQLINMNCDVAVYAFNVSKIITTIFGGMLIFNDEKIGETVRKWRDKHTKSKTFTQKIKLVLYLWATYVAFKPLCYRIIYLLQNRTKLLDHFTKAYHLDNKIHFPPDANTRMSNLQAEIGSIQLLKYDELIMLRRSNAKKYQSYLKKYDFVKTVEFNVGATYSHYPVTVPENIKLKIMEKAAHEGIEFGELIQYSIPKLPEYRDHCRVSYPNSEFCSKTTLNLPLLSPHIEIDVFPKLDVIFEYNYGVSTNAT
ncbi:dTDP-4-amino-4C6-dideoxy-D-glucose transaminase [Rhodobacteraceae bacterium SB2]|nr:dTDP-4-amino-4C6-dideoxy-D-glucose transaminase [Rhodobacteraceae bacterium SB2]